MWVYLGGGVYPAPPIDYEEVKWRIKMQPEEVRTGFEVPVAAKFVPAHGVLG